ncbi:MAG: DMT family transporter [Actinobacteria bacterium]|nr:MAG: DMT family transporter [Actinomycetota bacterium]
MLERATGSERSARRLGVVAVWVATFAWAWGYILVKWSSLDGLHFAMFRLWTGAAISCIALLGTRRRLTRAAFRACALGGVFFAADIGLGFSAIKHTTIADVAVIGALAPVAIGSSGSPSWSPFGDLLAVCGIGTWSAYWFFSRHVRERADPIVYFACVMLAAALVMTPTAFLLAGVPSWPTARDWFAIVGVALVPGFVGHTLVIWSHRHVESWLSALITQCSPVVTVTLAWILLGESLPALAIAGGAIVIVATGVVLVAAARRDGRADLDEAAERVS